MSTHRFVLTLLTLALTTCLAGGARAQSAMRGKSVVVSWTEQRMQRLPGGGDFRPTSRQGEFSAYVSTAGRIFLRKQLTNPRHGQSGKVDRVGGGPHGHASLSGHTMTAVGGVMQGSANLIRIRFDQGFTSCTAQVIRGKEKGVTVIHARSVIRHGARSEIASVSISGVQCAVRNGNVFGNE
jgi:hypothetical protein